jgi:signal peptidase II
MQERRTVTTLIHETEAGSIQHESHRGPVRRLAVALSVAAVVVLVDQLTKWWAVDRLSRGPIHLIGPLDLELTRNRGSAFSLFQGDAPVLIAIAVLLVAALSAAAFFSPTRSRAAVIGMIIGGAVGNLSDRLFRGHHGAVIDFIALHFWPTFNVADACIVIGSLALAFSLIRKTPNHG